MNLNRGIHYQQPEYVDWSRRQQQQQQGVGGCVDTDDGTGYFIGSWTDYLAIFAGILTVKFDCIFFFNLIGKIQSYLFSSLN